MKKFSDYLLKRGVQGKIFQHQYEEGDGLYQVRDIINGDIFMSLYHTNGEPWVKYSRLDLSDCLEDNEATESQVWSVENNDKIPYEFARTMERMMGKGKSE